MDDFWTAGAAEDVAEAEGMELGEKHWRVIVGARELIATSGCTPTLAAVSALCGIPLNEVQQLFPGAAEDLLARLAGAPELERREA